MYKYPVSFFMVMASFLVSLPIYGQMKVMTYNIKFDNPRDTINSWNKRKGAMVDFFQYYKPSIFGIQEGLVHQLNYLDSQLVDYARIGVGRDDGMEKGEFSAIYYDQNQFRVVEESTFWLSDQSDTISVGWDAAMERICTYGIFEDKQTKQHILVMNTHFDHVGKIAREKSALLILEKVARLNPKKLPIVLMGDFNLLPTSKPILSIKKALDDAGELATSGIYGPVGTFTGFKKGKVPVRRIDYIFTKGLKVLTYRHIDDKMPNNEYLSDHLPVMAVVK